MIRGELIPVAGHPGYQPDFRRDNAALAKARELGLPYMGRYTSYDGPSSHCHGIWAGQAEDLGPRGPGPNAVPV